MKARDVHFITSITFITQSFSISRAVFWRPIIAETHTRIEAIEKKNLLSLNLTAGKTKS